MPQSTRPHAGHVAGLAGALVLGLLVLAASAFLAQERGAGDLAKQQLEYTKAHYVKQEHRIPMRDGTKLFTVVYVPKDASRQLSDHDAEDALLRRPLRRREL